MQSNFTKKKTTISENMEALLKSLENKTITQDTFDLTVSVSKTNTIPQDTKLYLPYLVFLSFIKETFILFSRKIKYKKANLLENLNMNSFLLSTNKPEHQPSVEIIFNSPLKSLVVVNPVHKGIGSNFLRSFDPIGLETINSFILSSETDISVPNDWINFNTAFISREGVEVYLSLFSLQKVLSTFDGSFTFNFVEVPDGKETKTCTVGPEIIITSNNHQDLYKSLVFHGIVSVYGVISSISVSSKLSQVSVTYYTV